jgi:hypothetical protein
VQDASLGVVAAVAVPSPGPVKQFELRHAAPDDPPAAAYLAPTAVADLLDVVLALTAVVSA